MSQKVSRKSTAAATEEKEKRQANSPVKEMKKKMAANAEKEKQAAEKASDKQAEKTVEKPTEKPAEKVTEKAAEKHDKNEKPDKGDKKAEKADKSADKKSEKQTKEEQKKPEPEKSKAESSKEDKSGKPTEKPDTKKAEPSKAKQNGRDRVHNGVSDVTLGTNGTDDVLNGTVKVTRTPETPRPASDKQPDKDADDPKDKVLKLKEDATTTTDRRLRSSNSPKPQEGKKPETTKKDKLLDSPKKSDLEKMEEKDEDAAKSEKHVEVEVVVEVTPTEGEESQDKERSKTDTNFSKSRVKVSPYRRSMRLADQTNTSLQANYTGNNTTMEMDITESSSFMEDAPLDDSSYLRGLRNIRGRASYKQLNDISLRHGASRTGRSGPGTSASITSVASDSHSRPTGTVVGRKRKPESDDIELGVEITERESSHVASKRMRVIDRLTEPFRRVAAAAALPTVARRNAEIVGINTDLPLTAPVASADTFDPETLKPAPLTVPPLVPSAEPVAVPLVTDEKDNKRCVIM